VSTHPSSSDTAYAMEAAVARLLVVGTWLAMGLVLVGVILMLATGVDPLDHGAVPPFHLAAIPGEILALEPAGFLWAGIVIIIALPIGRVVVSGLGFLAARDLRMAGISLAVLVVVLLSVVTSIALEG
jgi:uncharacterized membrane protein